MRDLLDVRKDIDAIDKEILSLFLKRMGCAKDVADIKRGISKAIYDAKRENEKLEALTKDIDDEFMSGKVKELFTEIMKLSRDYQAVLLSDEK